MTSMLPEDDSNAVRMKHKLMSDGTMKEEARSFLSFSRENLSITHSDLEQGFNRSRPRPSRNTILSVAAFVVALLCLGLESWKLRCSLTNAREIEQLKRDVETLKHRFLEQNLMNVLKAFHEQLYPEESTENDDAGEADINDADYDSNYDEDVSASHDYFGDYPLIYGSRPSDFPKVTSTSVPIPTSPDPGSKKAIAELLTALHKVEAKPGQDFEKNVREDHKNPGEKEENTKLKRSVDDHAIHGTDHLTSPTSYQHSGRHHTRKTVVSKEYFYGESKANDNTGVNSTQPTAPWDRHPLKKYYDRAQLKAFPSTHDDQLSDEIAGSNEHDSKEAEHVGSERLNWRNRHHNATRNRTGNHRFVRNFQAESRQSRRKLTRRHLRASQKVCAIHYGANDTFLSAEDNHTGNGRAIHHNNTFKAWRASDWVADLNMSDYFMFDKFTGKLTVQESGLYLVYAQIHYLNKQDMNGFHLLVNGRPILQCTVYSPGPGEKSYSCFSAQLTVLQKNDELILKDVGSGRYSLFQYDKSFFGLVKLYELTEQQKHQSREPIQSKSIKSHMGTRK